MDDEWLLKWNNKTFAIIVSEEKKRVYQRQISGLQDFLTGSF